MTTMTIIIIIIITVCLWQRAKKLRLAHSFNPHSSHSAPVLTEGSRREPQLVVGGLWGVAHTVQLPAPEQAESDGFYRPCAAPSAH